jgi:hypothetical protein
MPTATPFKALGRGNGLPFCATELAVEPVDGSIGMTINNYNSLYATWNGGSFSGLSSGLGFSQPFNDILNAMPFFWNLYNFNLSSSVSATLGTNTQSASVTNLAISQSVEITPKNRACRSNSPTFKDNDPSASINFLFAGIYYFGTGSNKKYYWGLISTKINPGVSGGNILPRTYENRQNPNEYDDFILSITTDVKIAMAFYSTTAFDSVTATALVNSVTYYTY